MEKQGVKRKDWKGVERKLGDGDRKWQAYRQGRNVRIVKWNMWKGKLERKWKQGLAQK